MRKTPRDPLLAARETTHGDFGAVAELEQSLKELMRGAPNWERMPPTMRSALDLKATKLARLLCGDFAELEHWRDDAGYSKLVLERLPERKGAGRRNGR
ncbi:hypothetical protein LG047_12595 [Methylocystis sp. WRRC1]|uniref:hypothetical protein n=1 Tax=unclassified Methylocystis TaxID=2625913 RepID=UPI0001F86A8B|nr:MULTISPECIES: hypothetical protein [unclassified Methylocystis]MCC3246148.1 hypothetical protein [Methylocystis sp. WRRC1]